MQDLKNSIQLEDDLILKKKAIDYITIGVGCNCLVALSEIGLLDTLLNNGYVSDEEIKTAKNASVIFSSLVTLEKCEVVIKKGNAFYITKFGRMLARYIGLVTIFFDGYAELVAKQGQISRNRIKNKGKLIKGQSVSKASILISEKMIDPIVVKEIAAANLSGTICDLGCGYAEMLSKICKRTGNPGLGFESEPKVVEQVSKRLKGTNISIELGDISNLQGIWEDVVSLVQCHVFHDFTPEQKCVDIMNSYLTIFPSIKCFFYIDTVSPSADSDELFPGFDYVHGLLGITTRTYEETLRMFSASKYKIVKEIVLELPNTFLWMLSPHKKEN